MTFASAARKQRAPKPWQRQSSAQWRAFAAKKPGTNKYNARKVSYGGHLYHSQMEANYAAQLDVRVRAGKLKAWRRQVSVPLVVEGKTICRYVVDFVEEYPDGSEVWVEVKGFETEIYKLKAALFRVLFPERKYQVVKVVR